MPTGYTADIAKGISFQQYAWGCARAFGALVTMRDDPAGAPIPDAFEPSDYHVKAIAETTEQLASMRTLSGNALSQVHAEAVAANDAYNTQYKRDKAELRAKYEAMLAHARAYKPPTPDHAEFAKFMVSQIEQSIDFDCSEYQREAITADPLTWKAQQIEKLEKSLAYHRESYQKEIERVASRNAWLASLRASLACHNSEDAGCAGKVS